MLELSALVIFLTGLSLFIQDRFRIPSPITLLTLVLASKALGLSAFQINGQTFDQIILMLLPVLILVDVLALRLDELRTNAMSLMYVAVLSVGLSVVAGAALNHWILPDYQLTIPALVLLFCMVMATDPITVSSVFGNFKIPHKLKILAEGESLFNDATALIIFGIALNFLGDSSPTLAEVSMHAAAVVFGAIAIGLVTGFIGLWMLSLSRNPVVETAVLLSIAFVAFAAAEHFHWSGILAIIVGGMTANHVITKRIEQDDAIIAEEEGKSRGILFKRLDSAVEDKANHLMIQQNIRFTATLGTTVLFMSVGELVTFELLMKYWKEILSVFVATTVIRSLMMSKFAFVSNQVGMMQNVSVHWWMILSMAGVKGGLSILMLHLIPSDYAYLELFEAIVIGNILLTTFLYPLFLTLIINRYKQQFEVECAHEPAH